MTGDGSEDHSDSGSDESGTDRGGGSPDGRPESGHPDGQGGDEARPSPSGEHDEPGNAQPGGGQQGTGRPVEHRQESPQQAGTEEAGAGQRYCPECGARIDADAAFCTECGARQRPSSGAGGSDGEKDRIAAALLGMFLGGLGAHKFYLGDVGRGILYLCFSWTLIPSLVGLVEGIVYLTKSDEEFQQQYGE